MWLTKFDVQVNSAQKLSLCSERKRIRELQKVKTRSHCNDNAKRTATRDGAHTVAATATE